MSNYVTHLQELSNPLTFVRKKRYIDFNLKSYFKEIGYQNLRVLEVGPGLGEFESYLNDNKVCSVDIVDNDKAILDYVTRRYKVNHSFLIKDLISIDKKLGQYNFIFLMQILEHLPVDKYAITLKILYKHLTKGGVLAIVVPNGNNPLGMVERYGDLQHTSCFTEQSLKDLVNVSGIENFQLEIKGYEIPPYDLLNILRIFFQKILHLILLLVMIVNGGIYFKTMTPNIMLVIKREMK